MTGPGLALAVLCALGGGPRPGASRRSALRPERAFERNLRGMLRAAARRGVPVLAVAPPMNYRDAPLYAGPAGADARTLAARLGLPPPAEGR